MSPEFKDLDLAHVTTSTGVDVHLRRTPGGQLRASVRIGPTDPTTNLFPIATIDYDELRLILMCEQTSALSTIAEAVSQHTDDGIPALLANVGAEMNPGDVDSFAARLLRAIGKMDREPIQ
jgi:hypothetical protein